MYRAAWWLPVCGCPYLFEPPDESNVADPAAPGADGADADTDVDADTDADTGPVAPGDPPTVPSFEVHPRLDGVTLSFSIADADQDLVGGTLEATDGATTWTLGIPGDLDVWDPQGVSRATIVLGEGLLGCDTPSIDQGWTLTPTDYAGHRGTAGDARLTITSVGLLAEAGDVWPDDAHVLSAPPPLMGCVAFDTDHPQAPGTIREQLFWDVEAVVFTTPETRDYRVSLTWLPAADVDIFVFPYPVTDDDGDGDPDLTTSAVTYAMPEEALLSATAGKSWLFDPTFFDLGPSTGPPYLALFLVTAD